MVNASPLASFLRPVGFDRPTAAAVLRERSFVGEAGRYALRLVGDRLDGRSTSYLDRVPTRTHDPVILVPGFLAGDASLGLMARSLRSQGFRTYRSLIHANVGCTMNAAAQLEARLESIAIRRETRVQIAGQNLGGLFVRAGGVPPP